MSSTITSRERADCAVVSLAKATGIDYEICYKALAESGRRKSRRTYSRMVERAIKKLGFKCRYRTPKSVTMRTINNHCPVGVPAVVLCTGHFVAWDGNKIIDGDSTTCRKRVHAILDIIRR
jgi:hypothetical protein